jgi:propanol-preferring alcohol dehydrogenase
MSEPTFDIPKIQKAAVVAKTGNTVQVRNDLPVKSPADLAPGECLVKLHCTGVCHTDLHAALGDWPVKPVTPLIGGHEGVGEIVAIGKNTSHSPVKLGQRVGIKWIADSYVSTHSFSILQIDNPFRCLNCEQCKKGHEQSESISDVREYPLQEYLFSYQIDCYNVKLSGYTVDGTFSQYVVRFCCYNVFSFVITFPPGILRQFRYAHT